MKTLITLLISTFIISTCIGGTKPPKSSQGYINDKCKDSLCIMSSMPDSVLLEKKNDSIISTKDSPNIQHIASTAQTVPTCQQEYIGDSIKSIIKEARKITCTLKKLNPVDTLRKDSTKILPRKFNPIFKFLLLDPSNFRTNDIVYGIFQPDVCYKLCVSKNKYIYIQFDFGLRKWKLVDSKEQEIYTSDMKMTYMQILRLTRLYFSEDLTLELLYNNLNSK